MFTRTPVDASVYSTQKGECVTLPVCFANNSTNVFLLWTTCRGRAQDTFRSSTMKKLQNRSSQIKDGSRILDFEKL